MISLKYTCALLAGMVLSLLAFSAGVDTAPKLAADDDPFVVFGASQITISDAETPQRFDDGLRLAGGAFVTCPDPQPRSVVVTRTTVRVTPVCVTRSGWWTRGPVRRVISFPVRAVIGARARRAGGR